MTASSSIALLGEALFDVFPDRDVIGGAPFNVARNLAALGARPLMVTRIGDDARGDAVAAEFARFGMDTTGLQRDLERPTGAVTVHMDGTHHRFEIQPDAAWDRLDPVATPAAVVAAAPSIVYFGTLAQRETRSRDAMRAALDATTATRFLDLNLRAGPDNRVLSDESLARAQLVKVNDDELDQLLVWFGDGPAPAWGSGAWHVAVERLIARYRLRRLVVTRGEKGWIALDAAVGVLSGASPRVTVKDTVGAGDAFASVLLLGEASGWPLAATLERAAGFASAVCTLQGAVSDDHGFYDRLRADWRA